LFIHYDILNLFTVDYHDTYINLFADFDLGYSQDDYLGSDVKNGMFYVYNGKAIDDNGQPGSYGEHLPALGLKVIGRPFLPEDGTDNPAGSCDNSINGLNFGDNIVDNERLGMTNSFLNFFNDGMEPFVAPDYYKIYEKYWVG